MTIRRRDFISATSLLLATGILTDLSSCNAGPEIPAQGEVKYVCPAFEEARLRERITIGKEVFAPGKSVQEPFS